MQWHGLWYNGVFQNRVHRSAKHSAFKIIQGSIFHIGKEGHQCTPLKLVDSHSASIRPSAWPTTYPKYKQVITSETPDHDLPDGKKETTNSQLRHSSTELCRAGFLVPPKCGEPCWLPPGSLVPSCPSKTFSAHSEEGLAAGVQHHILLQELATSVTF